MTDPKIDGYLLKIETLKEIKEAIVNQKPFEIETNWQTLGKPVLPPRRIWGWGFINKRFMEVV